MVFFARRAVAAANRTKERLETTLFIGLLWGSQNMSANWLQLTAGALEEDRQGPLGWVISLLHGRSIDQVVERPTWTVPTLELRPSSVYRQFGAGREGRVEREEKDGLCDFLRRPP